MISLKNVPTTVPGIDNKPITVNPGDLWPLPYRGSRYTIKKVNNNLQMCWTRMDVVHPSSLPKDLIQVMIKFKNDSRGSIRVTPYFEVITKRKEQDGKWQPIYLGKFEGTYTFKDFDLNPTDIQTGNIWPGFHFKHGEEFAVWNRSGNDDFLYWTKGGVYFRSIDKYPELCSMVRMIRPRCGRIYITEFEHIWMNLPKWEVSVEWSSRFNHLLQEDKQKLADNDTLLRSVFERVSATQTYPIYLGKMSDFDSGVAPRTHFSGGAKFGLGGEDVDDGEAFDSDWWKNMKRDH